MPRITANPNLQEAPDFTSEAYKIVHNALAAAQEITAAEVAFNLTAALTTENDVKKAEWNAQEQEDEAIETIAWVTQEEQEERDKQEKEKVKLDEQTEWDKKKPKLNAMAQSKQVATIIKLFIMTIEFHNAQTTRPGIHRTILLHTGGQTSSILRGPLSC